MSTESMLMDYVMLDKERRMLEEKLAHVKMKMGEMEQPVLDVTQEHAIQNTKIAGLTLYIDRRIWARAFACSRTSRKASSHSDAAM